jgi:hypothetical protein
MTHRMISRHRAVRPTVATAAAALLSSSLAPPAALAHGIAQREDLPIPQWLFAWGAAVVLVVSFVALGVLWPRPRLEGARQRQVLELPAITEVLGGFVGVAVFAFSVYIGFAGVQTASANLLPTMVFVIFWVGIPFATLLLGDVWRAFSPWLAVARAVSWLTRKAGVETPAPLAYPRRLGHWPAAAGILAFAWVELAYTNRDDPSTLAIMALAYAAVQLVGMSLYGIRPWTEHADAFSVYFGLFSRLSPLHWRDRRLYLRPLLSGATGLRPIAGTLALLCVMIGSTSFDGLSNGSVWTDGAEPPLQRFFSGVGLGAEHAVEAAYTVGLLAVIGIVAGLYLGGVNGMRSIGRPRPTQELARRFAHTLIPIALAYVIAHYFSLLAYQGQAVSYLASDPLGTRENVLGMSGWSINYNVVGANGIWYVQVAALVAGHIAGLTLAHDRALVTYRKLREATRSQYWMLAIMVAFTSLGLWLLSAQA